MELESDAKLSFRSYDGERNDDRHAFAQLVLPVGGMLDIDVGGRGCRLDLATAAFIEPHTLHSQSASGANRFLIVDFDTGAIAERSTEQLARLTFLSISPATRRLIDFVDLATSERGTVSGLAHYWTPLLLDSLAAVPARPKSRLGVLLGRLEAAPGAAWTTEAMARTAGMSVSRLHALFQAELGRSPQAWLADLRLRRVQEWLAGSTASIAALAHRAGYSDQSALTRAMRRATGLTPAAYRRQQQELRPNNR